MVHFDTDDICKVTRSDLTEYTVQAYGRSPPLAGDLRLLDIETGDAQEVTVNRPMRNLYRRRVDSWRREISDWCLGHQVHFVPISTEVPWEQLVLQTLRTRGLIQ